MSISRRYLPTITDHIRATRRNDWKEVFHLYWLYQKAACALEYEGEPEFAAELKRSAEVLHLISRHKLQEEVGRFNRGKL